MRFGGKAAASWRIQLLTIAGVLLSAVVAKDSPTVKTTSMNNPPLGISYFEDSDTIVFHDYEEGNVYRSDDAGVTWNTVKGVPDGIATGLIMHRYEPKTAFILTDSKKHFKTEDRGASWTSWNSASIPSFYEADVLSFHASDPKRIIFNGMSCESIFCSREAKYTTDGFESIHTLRPSTAGCHWAKASPEFTTGDDDLDKKRTMCIVAEGFASTIDDQKLRISDSFFESNDGKIAEFEPKLNSNKEVDGVVNLAVVKSYLLVATSSSLVDEMVLYVSKDTQTWHRAMFPTAEKHDHSHMLTEAYTVLESTNSSIQIDALTSHPSHPMGVLFTSNSNGTYFTENVAYTNRNKRGHVDFEKISGIQGVYLVNVVENGHDVDEKGADKKVVSKITFDDGRTFSNIKAGEETIHVHSETELDNTGRVFSSPAPGLAMANGNTGDQLGDFTKANLYVSDNAGVSWKEALKGPHKYEFGDSGSILVAVQDSRDSDIDEYSYSLDHGETWKSEKLPDGLKIRPAILTTTQDSTSLKFLLLGVSGGSYHFIAIDFEGLHERTCGDDDMEDWHARVDSDGNPTCLMGHKQTYRRRKKTADCFVKSEFKDPVPRYENCKCTDADFECDYNFQRNGEDRSECVKVGPIARPEGVCGKPEDTFKGSSGWRLIPGNTCDRVDGAQKDDPVERKCSDAISAPSAPASGKVSMKTFEFDTDMKEMQKIHLERGFSSNDETVIARGASHLVDGNLQIDKKVWLSSNQGKDWTRILEGQDIYGIYPHRYFQDIVYFTTPTKKVIYTIDRGQTFHSFDAPEPPKGSLPLSFHPEKRDWLIWRSEKCDKGLSGCIEQTWISLDRGDDWTTLHRYANKCEFTGSSTYRNRNLKQVVCLARTEENNDAPFTVRTSDDFFQEDITTFDGQVTNFATMNEFIVLVRDATDKEDLQSFASLDGKRFEKAQFPHDFHKNHDSQYTLLDSSTHAVNMFVSAEPSADWNYGSIVKSNSNGTSYVVSATNVNANAASFVDFEKVQGLEGVAIINVVSNSDSKKDKKKEIQTKISHNDGARWSYLNPPHNDADGNPYRCNRSGGKSCALHLHHYTEREDRRKTFGAPTAVGLIFGVGNVGAKLESLDDADTFMSADAGITWTNVKKGRWTWQYGDQGSIITLVQKSTPKNKVKTKSISYSVDEGKTWTDFEFSDKEVTVQDLTTTTSGTSRNFIVWYQSDSKLHAVNIDFTGLTDRPCKTIDEADSDYTLWSPKHPTQDNDCLFGHVAKYLRKKPESNCYNEKSLKRLYGYEDCRCSRQDFECAYNYELDSHQQCSLVKGLQPLSGKEWCEKNPNATTWFEPTGYRKIPLSTCKGGELDQTTKEHPCEGFEEEFERKHRTSGVAIFFAVVIPICLAGAIGFYVYRNWTGKFGQIRLGDNQTSTFDSDQPWVKYPVIAISAVAAVVASLPLVFASLWRSASGVYERLGGRSRRGWASERRFTTRDSFARGRGDYSSIADDEGELLGEESDEDV
ncbi:unnamed protein product [Clonostachys rosea f. rosea IK726]|uniref:Uncharacterized protein n=2 Tax=Bionectria ochroleuca TaxID=29856 RepID=A0ACA9TBN8_BIOOC|nr:unnamed protein product [Clonostachys rosea f. rosea IK726]